MYLKKNRRGLLILVHFIFILMNYIKQTLLLHNFKDQRKIISSYERIKSEEMKES